MSGLDLSSRSRFQNCRSGASKCHVQSNFASAGCAARAASLCFVPLSRAVFVMHLHNVPGGLRP